MTDYPGSTFDAWFEDDGSGGYKKIEGNQYNLSYEVSEDPGYYHENKNIYAKFTAKTYHAKWPNVVIQAKDKSGNMIDVKGGNVTITLGNGNTGTQDGVTGSKTYDVSVTPTDIFTQTADDAGKLGQASYTWTINVAANEGYFIESAKCNNTTVPDSGTLTFANSTSVETKNSAPQQETITIVFKEKFTTYYSGPKAAFASNSADNGKITVNGTTTTKKANEIDLSESVGSVENQLKYQYTYKAENTDKATFVGWTWNADGSGIPISTDLEYTHKFTVPANNTGTAENPVETPTLYAVYESFYYKMPVLKFAEGSFYGAIATSVDGTRPTAVEDWKTENIECGSEIIQIPTGGQAKATVTYHYHAMVLDDQTSIFGVLQVMLLVKILCRHR